VEQEQVVLSNAVENESVTVVNDNPMDELKKEVDKQLIEDQHENVISVISVNSLNSGSVSNNNNDEIPTKSKRQRKVPITRTDDFLWLHQDQLV
jgi:hypothetical protein